MTSPSLSDPLQLPCGAVLANRIAKAAMSEQLGTRTQAPRRDRLETLYGRWARGGAGLLVTGNVMVDRRALGEPMNVALEDDRDLPAFAAWADAGSSDGCATWVQLNHPGRQSPRNLSWQPVAPSAIATGAAGRTGAFATPRALEGHEVEEIVERFGAAAALVRRAGFGGVQIHGAHGYLVSQFLSPHTNLRTDAWGGTAERRMRFALEVVRAVRARVGADFPIGVKLNSADFQRGGLDPEQSIEVALALEGAGIDLLEVSGGTYERAAMMGHGQRESTRRREAYFLEYATTLRQLTKMPLMVTGGFRSRSAMVDALRDGIDVVGMARPLTVEPELPARLLDGSVQRASLEPRSTGRPRLDGVADIAWHTQQMHHLGAGREPQPGRGAWQALARAAGSTVVNTVRRHRPMS